MGGGVSVVGFVDGTVHVAAADEGALAAGVAEGGEDFGGGDVRGGVVGCCCGAGAEGGCYGAGVDLGWLWRWRRGRLRGERCRCAARRGGLSCRRGRCWGAGGRGCGCLFEGWMVSREGAFWRGV